jgi:hypothetical protein
MGKRAYIATVELEYVVVVDDTEEGRSRALSLALKDMENDSFSPDDFELRPLTHIPPMYDDPAEEVASDTKEPITISQAVKIRGGYAHDLK